MCNIVNSDSTVTLKMLLSLNDSELTPLLYLFQNNKSVSAVRTDLQIQLSQVSPGEFVPACLVHRALWWSIPPILLLLGSTGNLLAGVVLFRHLIGVSSSYLYLTAMIVLDQITLITGLLRRFVSHATQQRLEDLSNLSCSLCQFCGVACSLLSVWLIVALTIERVLVIYMPLRAKRLTRKRNGKLVIGLLLTIACLISSHFFFTVEVLTRSSNNGSSECSFKQRYTPFLKLWTITDVFSFVPDMLKWFKYTLTVFYFLSTIAYVDASLYSLVPFFVLLVLNVLICHEMYKTRKVRNRLINSSTNRPNYQQRKNTTEIHHLSATLIAISIIFLLTTTPLVTFKLVVFFNSHKIDRHNIYHSAILQLLDTCFELLMYINHSINFLLYCMSGNKFRKHVIRTLKCWDINSQRSRCPKTNMALYVPVPH